MISHYFNIHVLSERAFLIYYFMKYIVEKDLSPTWLKAANVVLWNYSLVVLVQASYPWKILSLLNTIFNLYLQTQRSWISAP